MKRVVAFLTSAILITSLAAPAGVVFASEAIDIEPVVDSAIISEQNLAEEDSLIAEQTEQANEVESGQEVIIIDTSPALKTPDLLVEDSVMLPEDPIVSSSARNIVITELQTRGLGGASAELIELYNASDQAVDVTEWCLQRASATGMSYTAMTCIKASDAALSTRVMLPPYGYVVFASELTATMNPTLQYDLIFSAGMADTGGRMRVVDAKGQVIDLIGWGNAGEHRGIAPASAIPASQPLRSLQRVVGDSGEYQDISDSSRDFIILPAKTSFESGALYETIDLCINVPGIQEVVADHLLRNRSGECIERSSINFCESIRINEIAANTTKQYIELVNSADHEVSLAGCRIASNRSSLVFLELPNITLAPQEYYIAYINETSLLLSKSTTGVVYLLTSDGETEVESVTYEELSVDTSWSYFTDGWKQTYELTPKMGNVYAQFAACAAGQERHLETGRCRTVSVEAVLLDCGEGRERNIQTGRCRNIVIATALTPCKEGQYRNEETNRCRSFATLVSSLKPCADDQFRNPETNRCKKIASSDDMALADCGEGRERNPVTNRCRNVASTTPAAAGFAVEPVADTVQAFTGWWVLGGIMTVALAYAGWEWRDEIKSFVRKSGSFFRSSK